MKIGFSGSRMGMSMQQLGKSRVLIDMYGCKELHHGDCVGADNDMHEALLQEKIKLVVHPPIVNRYRAYSRRRFTPDSLGIEYRTPRSYYVRNRDIVDETDMLIATPLGEEEKGGTWYTINYARQLNRHIFIILPDGTTKEENL